MKIFKITTIKDDNELVRSHGTNLARNMSEAEIAETRRIIERLDRLANLLVDEFGFDKDKVMEDFFKDLQIIQNPRLLNNLDMNNSADVLTKEIVEMWQQDPDAFNFIQNNFLDHIMNMSDETALAIYRQAMPQLQAPQRTYYIGNNGQRRLR